MKTTLTSLTRLRTSGGLSWQAATAAQVAEGIRKKLRTATRFPRLLEEAEVSFIEQAAKQSRRDQAGQAQQLAAINRKLTAFKQRTAAAVTGPLAAVAMLAGAVGAQDLREELLAAIADVNKLIDQAYKMFDFALVAELMLILADLLAQLDSISDS